METQVVRRYLQGANVDIGRVLVYCSSLLKPDMESVFVDHF